MTDATCNIMCASQGESIPTVDSTTSFTDSPCTMVQGSALLATGTTAPLSASMTFTFTSMHGTVEYPGL